MVKPLPSPDVLKKRKLRDIKLRYESQTRDVLHRNRSRGMAAIRLSELSRWLDDQFGQGVELEPGTQGETITRIFAHHFGALRDAPRRIDSWLAMYAPWINLRSRERLIREAVDHPLKWSADKLAWKIRLDDATRTRLKIKTIGAFDVPKDQRQVRAKAKRKARDALRRPGKPPRAKPWIAAGVSRATWVRRR